MIKGLLLLLFILTFFFLARGLFLIIKQKSASKKPLHALMWRIGLSMAAPCLQAPHRARHLILMLRT